MSMLIQCHNLHMSEHPSKLTPGSDHSILRETAKPQEPQLRLYRPVSMLNVEGHDSTVGNTRLQQYGFFEGLLEESLFFLIWPHRLGV